MHLRFIPTWVHGIFDYFIGIFPLTSPDILNLYGSERIEWLPRHFGAPILFLALITRYELGLFKVLPMRSHLWADYVFGLLLAIWPWVSGFDRALWFPHLLSGVAVFLVALFTRPEPQTVYAEGL
jgi:hypothetical protein